MSKKGKRYSAAEIRERTPGGVVSQEAVDRIAEGDQTNGHGLSIVGRKEERAGEDYTGGRDSYVAYVRIRAADVLSIEDLPAANPDAGVGSAAPLKVNVGCVVQLRHATRPVKLSVLADEFCAAVLEAEDEGTSFVCFPWMDPDGKRSL